MLTIGLAIAAAAAFGLLEARRRWQPAPAAACRTGATAASLVMAGAAVLMAGSPVAAAIVPTVLLGTASDYAVLAASTVTNIGFTTLDGSLGLYPGTSVTGFPPGLVLPPGTTDVTSSVAQQAQSDVLVAYVDASDRPVSSTTTADLVNLTLQGGVYAGPDHAPLSLSGPLVLDGANDLTSVFIFQTDSSLITASASTVTLINGAQACNVFWQVGSSATLGSGSVFVGNILAQSSITVANNATVEGRALAMTGAVTLDDDTFVRPSCAVTPPPSSSSTTTAGGGSSTSTTGGGSSTTTAAPVSSSTTPAAAATSSTLATGSRSATTGRARAALSLTSQSAAVPAVVGAPRTGGGSQPEPGFPWVRVALAGMTVGAAATAVLRFRRRPGDTSTSAGR